MASEKTSPTMTTTTSRTVVPTTPSTMNQISEKPADPASRHTRFDVMITMTIHPNREVALGPADRPAAALGPAAGPADGPVAVPGATSHTSGLVHSSRTCATG